MLTEPLRSLPNGASDEILEDGTEIRRVGKIVLDGSEAWTNNGPWSGGDYQASYIRMANKGGNKLDLFCDKFVVDLQKTNSSNQVTNECCFGEVGNGVLYLIISKQKLNTPDMSGLKQWLSENPTTVYYELSEPIIKKHNKNINLKTFEGTTHITSDNYLLPTINCKVPSNVQAVVMSLKEENQELNNTITEMKTVHEEIELENIETNLDQDVRLTMLELGVI